MGGSPEQALQRGCLTVHQRVNGCTTSWMSRIKQFKTRTRYHCTPTRDDEVEKCKCPWGCGACRTVSGPCGLSAGTHPSPALSTRACRNTPHAPQDRGSKMWVPGSQGPSGVEQLQRWTVMRFHQETEWSTTTVNLTREGCQELAKGNRICD